MPDSTIKLMHTISKLLPAAFLYLLLFLPNPNEFSDLLEAEKTGGTISLSVDTAVFLTLFFYAPALIMFLWHEALDSLYTERTKMRPRWACRTTMPHKAACAARSLLFLILDVFFTLAGLFVIGISVSNLSNAFDFPVSAQQIIVSDYKRSTILAVSLMLCAGAVLEEFFFRRYLIAVCEGAGFGIAAASCSALLLFTLPHVWEGLFGMLNALLAGLYLTAVYLQNRSLLAPALAHSLYNLTAFLAML